MPQGIRAIAKHGIRVGFSMKIGHLTGKQAFTTWIDNIHRRERKATVVSLFKAAGYMRTSMRRGMARSGRAIADPTRAIDGQAVWASYRPSIAGRPPKFRPGNGKYNLRNIRFTKPSYTNLSSRIGPEEFPTSGQANVRFAKGHLETLEFGGGGEWHLPIHPDQNPFQFGHGNKWPFSWMPGRMAARPYAEPAVAPTLAQFPKLFARQTGT